VRATGLVAVVALAGCAALHGGRGLVPSSRAEAELERGNVEARAGRPREARRAYAEALAAEPTGPVAEDALWALALLYVDPESPLRDYQTAATTFGRLVELNPRGRHAEQARAWRSALRELARQEREASRLRADIDRLRELDAQMEDKR
jgi:tetratricopeptide (TPR) repeat protein